jgi:predicted metalloprotease with PDZ domain
LTDAFILAGNHFEGSIGTKGLEIKLALGGDLQKWKEEIRKAVEKLFDVCFRLFGGAPDRTLLLVANLYNRPHSCDGGVFGRSVSILMGNPPTSEYNQMWIPFVCHEMFHFWNGYAIKPQGQEYWFLEGFTEYYASVLPVRLALIGPESYLRSLASACQRYLERAGQISIRQAGDSKFDHPQLVYQGGCLIAAILDIQIRRLTKNDKGLDDVMRQIYQEYGEGSKRYTLEDVVKTCNEVSGSDLRGFFSSHVQGTGILPLERYLGEAGLNITRSGPSLKFVVFKLLKINSLTSTPEGLVVHRSQGAGYQDGDILVTIAGRSVQGNDDLCHVSRDLSPGDTVEIELLRSGQKTRQKVVLGGHDATDHQRFEPRVEITSKPQVSDLEQAILSGILTGKN